MSVFKYNMLHDGRLYVVVHANNPRAGWAEMGISGAQLSLAGKLAPIKDLIPKEVDSLPREDTRFVL